MLLHALYDYEGREMSEAHLSDPLPSVLVAAMAPMLPEIPDNSDLWTRTLTRAAWASVLGAALCGAYVLMLVIQRTG